MARLDNIETQRVGTQCVRQQLQRKFKNGKYIVGFFVDLQSMISNDIIELIFT